MAGNYCENQAIQTNPNHWYWRERMMRAAGELNGMFENDADSESFWATVDDAASCQQIYYACQKQIEMRAKQAQEAEGDIDREPLGGWAF